MRETFLPKSSNIDQIDYDSDEQKMVIQFKSGQAWEYSGVPQSVFMGIQNAPSAGSYFFRNIRGVYSDQEV